MPVREDNTQPSQQVHDAQARGISPALVRLMAVTCAVTVANLYYAQPLLHSIAASPVCSDSAIEWSKGCA